MSLNIISVLKDFIGFYLLRIELRSPNSNHKPLLKNSLPKYPKLNTCPCP